MNVGFYFKHIDNKWAQNIHARQTQCWLILLLDLARAAEHIISLYFWLNFAMKLPNWYYDTKNICASQTNATFYDHTNPTSRQFNSIAAINGDLKILTTLQRHTYEQMKS